MRILHILDHSLPLQSGYVYHTLSIVNQQRALGWEPLLLTSGKHYAAGPEREQIAGWGFFRTPRPTGLFAKLPWFRELRIVRDLGRRLDDLIGELRPDILHAHSPVLNALPALRVGRRRAIPMVYEVRALGGRRGKPWRKWPTSSALSRDSARRGLRSSARGRCDDDLRGHARRGNRVPCSCRQDRRHSQCRGP
ncbi:MAG: glycosyltransferase [Stellaceae bacterium]